MKYMKKVFMLESLLISLSVLYILGFSLFENLTEQYFKNSIIHFLVCLLLFLLLYIILFKYVSRFIHNKEFLKGIKVSGRFRICSSVFIFALLLICNFGTFKSIETYSEYSSLSYKLETLAKSSSSEFIDRKANVVNQIDFMINKSLFNKDINSVNVISNLKNAFNEKSEVNPQIISMMQNSVSIGKSIALNNIEFNPLGFILLALINVVVLLVKTRDD